MHSIGVERSGMTCSLKDLSLIGDCKATSQDVMDKTFQYIVSDRISA